MAYRGFSGGGFVGNHLTTALLEQLRPAADNAGRHATVGDPSTRAAPYTSDGESWKAAVLLSADGTSLVSGDGAQWLIPGAATFTASDAGTDWYRVPDVLQVAATLDSGTSTTVLVEVRTAAGVVSTALTITADTVAQTLRNSILTREMHEFRIRRSSGTGTVTVIV